MASKSKGFKKLVEQFSAITGASEEIGHRLLEVCNGNLEMAIGMHLEGETEDEDPGNSEDTNQASTSAADQEDNVRAPIPQKRDILVQDPYAFGPRPRRRGGRGSVFDRFRDFQAEAKAQEDQMRNMAAGKSSAKKKTLEDLFRPPIDIMHKGTFNTARETGQSQCKWVLVNVQNVQEFSCQQLNRDVWSNSAVKSIIQEHFIFWQVYHDSEEGQRYTQFYKITEFPYIAIIDPRTGEKLMEWHKLDSMTFCDLVTEFLSSHPIFDNDGLSPPPKKKVRRSDSIIDASEDSQLEAAIAASLAETSAKELQTEGKRKKTRAEIIVDDDGDEDSETFHSIHDSSSDSENTEEEDLSEENSPVNSRTVAKLENGTSHESVPKLNDNSSVSEPFKKIFETRTADQDKDTNRTVNKNTNNDVETKDNMDKQLILNDDVIASDEEKDCADNSVEYEDNSEEEVSNEVGPKAKLMIRFPDGKRKQMSLPATAKLTSLVKLVIKEGYSNERYELVTNFPRRKLSYLEVDTTLQEAGLFPQETVFVQER
ncbi:UBX domain-containing protein 7-like [Glandiceps talaboti]